MTCNLLSKRLHRLGGALLAILTAPLTVPVVLLVRIIRPFLLIRFGPLLDRRIGHFSSNIELYLCEREAGIRDNKAVDIFFHTNPVSNRQLKKMWDRTPDLRICGFACLLDKVNRYIPGGKIHKIPPSAFEDRDIHNLFCRIPPHLFFTGEEERRGQRELLNMGIPAPGCFVCFYARDAAYLNSVLPHVDWGYQDYRDCSINNQVPAVEEMAGRGYFALRMGAVVKDPLRTNNPKIIDYAHNYRSDFLDIYTLAKCRFFISAAAGLASVPALFRRPIVWVNLIPIGYLPSWGPNELIITKKLMLRKEKRFLTFKEIFDSGAGGWLDTKNYEDSGIDIIENTPEEILAVTIEMDERLKGTWKAQEDDEELQQRFWSMLRPKNLHGKILARIGADFLRQNRQLLM